MPPISVVLASWRLDPVGLAVLLVAAGAYAAGVRAVRRRGGTWRLRRTVAFGLVGLGAYALLTQGFPGVYSAQLRWVFTLRLALLLVVVPTLVLLGRPAELARAATAGTVAGRRVEAFLGSRVLTVLGSAFVAPLVPFAVFLLLLTPVGGWLRVTLPGAEIVTVAVPIAGVLVGMPLLDGGIRRTATFAIAEFLVAFVELVLDAIPGIVLRISNGILDGATTAASAPWAPNPLRDQQLAGDLLWFVAEVGDLPAIVLLISRWVRSDRKDATDFDALSDEEVAALTAAHLRRAED